MSEINTLRSRFKRLDTGRSSSTTPSTNASDLPLDHQLTFNRNPNEKWTYGDDGHFYLNGEEVEELLTNNSEVVSFQSGVSEALSEYSELVRKKNDPRYSKFASRVDNVQTGILGNMKRIYDEKTGGMSLQRRRGELFINNIDLRRILAMYHLRPTPKAQTFLRNFLAKLNLILMNKSGSPHFERANDMIKSLYAEVKRAIDTTPINVDYLPAGSSDRNC